jgi:hypothetical protein
MELVLQKGKWLDRLLLSHVFTADAISPNCGCAFSFDRTSPQLSTDPTPIQARSAA